MTKLVTFLPFLLTCLHAENGQQAWLRYARVSDATARQYLIGLPAAVTTLGESPVLDSARSELIRGVRGQLGRTLREQPSLGAENSFVIGNLVDVKKAAPEIPVSKLDTDAFALVATPNRTFIVGGNDRGALYGVFALLRKIAVGEPIAHLNEQQTPYAPVRWVNQWDRIAGTIERGYGGRSIFFDNGNVREDLTRVSEY